MASRDESEQRPESWLVLAYQGDRRRGVDRRRQRLALGPLARAYFGERREGERRKLPLPLLWT